ncbi:MAG: nucleotidyltransferase family protein [Planctomycetota bacterium]
MESAFEENISNITAAILAGGFGTRLQSVLSDTPKVLAEVSGRPFLAYILEQLSFAGFRSVVICTGYMGDKVQDYFRDAYGSLRITYSKEDKPLGTGGALRLALPCVSSDAILVMNGDSYIDADLTAYADWFLQKQARAALLLTTVSETTRYGAVTVDEGDRIITFDEKGGSSGPGWINAGIYLMKKSLAASIPAATPYSLEHELFPSLAGKELLGYCCEAPFIDIGTPESYARAESFFAERRHENVP